MIKSPNIDWGHHHFSTDFLYSDAVLHAAGLQDQVWRLHSIVALDDVLLNLLKLSSELVNQLQSRAIGKVLLHVVAQRNLGRTQEAIKGCRAKKLILIDQVQMVVPLAEAVNSSERSVETATSASKAVVTTQC